MDTAPGWYTPAADESPEWGPCPACGTANAAVARFCQACGRPLVQPEPEPVAAEVLTAVVCELTATSGAFSLAAEADLRLTAARDALAAAGGTLRELTGSPHTVAAVFGPAPRDGISTLIAVRAAATARDAVSGGTMGLRVGVGGSDVRGDDASAVELWRGRVVDLALRLSRMATPGEVILGEGAYRLIRDSVDVEAIDPRVDLDDDDDVGPLRVRALRTPAPAVPPVDADGVAAAPTPEALPGEEPANEPSRDEPDWHDEWGGTFGWAGTLPDAPAADELAPADQASPWETDVDAPADEAALWAETDVEPPADETAVWREPEMDADGVATPQDRSGTALFERAPVLSALRAALEEAIAGSRPVTLTLGGSPGSGRTSVARWFVGESADRAWTIEMACRKPEAGGTAWPFAPLVRAAIGLDGPVDRADLGARLRAALEGEHGGEHGGEHVAALVRYLSGDEGGMPPDQTRAAIAALLTATVRRRPLVVIVDDADRASAASRAAFEAVAAAVGGPLLVIFVSHEPADVVVPPLSDAAAGELVERLLAGPNLTPDATAALVGACRGIPLAVEHLVAMLADDGHLRWEYGRWTPTVDLASLPLPADLPSLVARRIAGLRDAERSVAAVAAVPAEVFDAVSVAAALGPEAGDVRATCAALVDRGILRAIDDERFAFGHDAIAERAAAYADRDAARVMHAIAADRLSENRAPGPDVDEAIGAHLERSFRIAGPDTGRETTGRRAVEHLVRAARGAADVGDEDACLALLRRAAGLLPKRDPDRAQLLLESAARLAGRGDESGTAERLLGEAVHAARASGDELLELRATVARARMLAEASRTDDQIEALRDAAEAAVTAATARGDHPTAADAWSARGWVHTVRGNFAGAADAFERAATAAAAAGRRRDEVEALRDLAGAIVDGPAPVDEAIERCRSVLRRAQGTGAEPSLASALAVLLARRGRADEARETLASAIDPDADVDLAAVRCRMALVELHAGSADRGEEPLRTALQTDMPAPALGALRACLAYVLTELGRVEAISVADEAAALADENDIVSQVTWRAAKARCLAVGGRHAEARGLARLALRLADQTDLSELRARTRLDLAEVLLATGRANEAGPAARAAVRAIERKGSVAQAARAQDILNRIAARPATEGRSEAGGGVEGPHGADGGASASDGSGDASGDDGAKRERRWLW
jgi:tetratricopeptide (TPR) repeat protein